VSKASVKRIAVIGGGIIGVAVARELTRVMPDSAVTVHLVAQSVTTIDVRTRS